MTDMNLGTSSAKRATWREEDTRPLLQRIINTHPRADDKELFKFFWKEVEDDKDHLRSIALYWFELAMLALRRNNAEQRKDAEQQRQAAQKAAQQATQKAKTALKERLNNEARILLLEMLMPNGKVLGQCTGAECRTFGGWFAALARKVPAKKTVAAVMTEDDIRRLWKISP